MEIVLNSPFTDPFKGQNRGWTMLFKHSHQFPFVFHWNRVSQDEEVKTAGFAFPDGFRETECRSYGIALRFKKHLTGSQETPVIGD